MDVFLYLIGLAGVSFALGHVMRFAYRAGRADREVETRLREDLGAEMADYGRRLSLIEKEDATRRRQIHDVLEEFEEVIGPTNRDRIMKMIQETSATRTSTPRTQRQRYGLERTTG